MKNAIRIQHSITYLILITLLVFGASCKKDPIEYSLNVNISPAGSGTISIAPSGGFYEEGTEVSLTPMPTSDYIIKSWGGPDASSVNNNRISMSKDMDITANFEMQTYSLNVNISPAGSGAVSLSPSGGIYEVGTEVTLTPVPASDYIFTSWSGTDASSVNNNIIAMNKNMDITANFEIQTLIRLKTGSGLNSGAQIYFVALSKNVNYFDLTSDEMFDYDKTVADWYIDGGVIPFTTDYKEFDLSTGEYYFLVSASGLVMVTTVTVLSGKQSFEIYGTDYGVGFHVLQDKKSTMPIEEESRRIINYKR